MGATTIESRCRITMSSKSCSSGHDRPASGRCCVDRAQAPMILMLIGRSCLSQQSLSSNGLMMMMMMLACEEMMETKMKMMTRAEKEGVSERETERQRDRRKAACAEVQAGAQPTKKIAQRLDSLVHVSRRSNETRKNACTWRHLHFERTQSPKSTARTRAFTGSVRAGLPRSTT